MSRVSSILAAILLVGVAACDAPTPTEPLTQPSAQFAAATPGFAPSTSGGAVLVSDEVFFAFANFDVQRGLMSVHGYFVQLCEGDALSRTPRTSVITPSAISQRLVKLGEDDQPVVIYRTTTGALTCALINSPEARVASGFVHHSQVFTLASFTATWRGTVSAPDGSTHHLTENYQLTADIHDPNNPDLWSLNTARVLIH